MSSGAQLLDLVWSYSALDNFETCPRNFAALKVHKSHREEEGDARQEAMDWGNSVHKAMDNYVRFNKPVPLQLNKFVTVINHLASNGEHVSAELRVGITRDLQLTAFFNDDVALRVVIDLMIERKELVVLDWKTSKTPRETDTQLKISALAGLVARPKFERALCAFVYTDHPTKQAYLDRSQLPEFVTQLNTRLAPMKEAIDNDQFPARRCWKCSFCPVLECEFNRSRFTRR